MKIKLHTIFLLMGLLLISHDILSQRYCTDRDSITVISLENKPVKVNISFDYPHMISILTLSTSDTICRADFTGLVDKVKLLNENFIAFNYQMRGGSGVAIQRTVLIGVSNGKFVIVADLLSCENDYFTWAIREYKLAILKLETDNNGYNLIVREHDTVESKTEPSKNHETIDTLALRFDKKNKVFYNDVEMLKGQYSMDHNGTERFFKGNICPVIRLKNECYYFMDNHWYFYKEGRGKRFLFRTG